MSINGGKHCHPSGQGITPSFPFPRAAPLPFDGRAVVREKISLIRPRTVPDRHEARRRAQDTLRAFLGDPRSVPLCDLEAAVAVLRREEAVRSWRTGRRQDGRD